MGQSMTSGNCSTTAAGSTTVSSPTLIQYPAPPADNTGASVMFGSMIGSILGRLANGALIGKAKDAENKWLVANDKLAEQGVIEYGIADAELTRANAVNDCVEAVIEKFCAYAQCGYKPDYHGVLARATADADILMNKKIEEVCRLSNRYNSGVNADVVCNIITDTIGATIAAVVKGREQERQFMWEYNNKVLTQGVQLLENIRTGRHTTELAHRQAGGAFASSAGQNYGWLAQSYRTTATKDISDFSQIGGLIGSLVVVKKLFNDTNLCA